MKKIFLILTVITSNLLFGQENVNIHNTPHIEVTGEGKMEVVPDEIYLTISISEADRGKLSMEKLELDMLKRLEDIGIDVDEQLKVLNFNSGFKNRVLGQKINTSKQYELMLNETRQVPVVFAELEKLNISNINFIRVDHSDRESLEMEVKVAAVRSAKNKAQRMLQELGNQVGKPILIQERSSGHSHRYQSLATNSELEEVFYESRPLPDLDFQSIVIQYSVQVRFAID